VVALGGGTGIPNLLAGLRACGVPVTVVVTVADDGKSSGIIRKAFDMPSPGDLRNCMVALAGCDPVVAELMQFRFDEPEFAGHAFGNIMIAALTRLLGDFDRAVQMAHEILQVQGRVIPVSVEKIALVAQHEDGTKSTGEAQISGSHKRIRDVSMRPGDVHAPQAAIEALKDADLVIFGPGSLYTSVMPNLLVKGIVEALAESRAKKLYICNLMTQPGETSNYTVLDHVQAVLRHSATDFLDGVLVNSGNISQEMTQRYFDQNATPVVLNVEAVQTLGCELFQYNIVDEGERLRHDPLKLAQALLDIYETWKQPDRV